jgi:pimeloyl-ACP methyl ester carboxylesterase
MTACWVLLRGLTREAGHWGDFPARVQRVWPQARIVTPDLPGAGASRAMRAPLQVAAMAAHVRAQLQAQGLVPPYRLFGLSLGGMVATHWALAWPQELTHLVLASTSMRPLGRLHERLLPGCWPGLLGALCAGSEAAAERCILHATSARADALEGVLDDWVAVRRARPVSRANGLRQLWAAARYRLPDGARPAMPVLVLAGAGDRLVDPVCSQRLAARWGCGFALHPWAGHDLPLDDADWVCERLRECCDQPAASAATSAAARAPL